MEDQRLIQILRELPREHPPEGFTAAVLARSTADHAEPGAGRREEPRRPSRKGSPLVSWFASPGFASAVAPIAAVAVVAIGGFLAAGLLTSRPASPPPQISPPPAEGAAAGERHATEAPDQGAERSGGPADHQPEMVRLSASPAPGGSGPLGAGEAQILLRQLSGEQHQLARELRELREPSPVIFLGGTERTEVVLDLRRAGFAGASGRVAPAAVEHRPMPERL